MSIIFTGDCHFRDRMISRVLEMQGDTEFLINEVKLACLADYANTKNTALILGGDIYDVKTPPPHLIISLSNLIRELKEANILTYYITGNHDANYESGKEWGDVIGAIPLHGRVTNICGVNVYGINHLKRTELLSALAAIPEEVEVLVLHQALKDALSFVSATGDAAWNLETEDVPPHVRLVLLADIHTTFSTTNETTLFVYSGSLVSTSITETPQKYVITVTPDDSLAVEHTPIASRNVLRFSASTRAEILDIYTEICKWSDQTHKSLKPVVELTYTLTIDGVSALLDKIRDTNKCFFLAIPAHGSPSNQTTSLTESLSISSLNMADYVHFFINNEAVPDAVAFAQAFLNSDKKQAFLKQYRLSLFKEKVV